LRPKTNKAHVPRFLLGAIVEAAGQGEPWAQHTLGRLYESGEAADEGIAQDFVQAYVWYDLAASLGYEKALADRDRVAECMTPERLAEAKQLAQQRKTQSGSIPSKRVRPAKKGPSVPAEIPGELAEAPQRRDFTTATGLELAREGFAIGRPPQGWDRTEPGKGVLAEWTNASTNSVIRVVASGKPGLTEMSWKRWNDVFLISAKAFLPEECQRFSVKLREGFEQGATLNGFHRSVLDLECWLFETGSWNKKQAFYLKKGKRYVYSISLISPESSYENDAKAFATLVQSFRILDEDEQGRAAYRQGDYATALEVWSRRAGLDDPQAQRGLGEMYRRGYGVEQNDAEAVKWYRKAAEQLYPEAQNDLGEMYLEGRGVPRDDAQAYKWFTLAASQGHEMALQNRSRVAERMTAEQISEAKRRVVNFTDLGLIAKHAGVVAPGAAPETGAKPDLFAAIGSGDIAEVKAVLAAGADVNARGVAGIQPLHYATMLEQKPVVDLLLSLGADVNGRTDDGLSPLCVAVRAHRIDMAELLLSRGADVDSRTKSGYTALLYAASEGRGKRCGISL
jgi:TPR repeat protein